MNRVLLDTGPLVALFLENDSFHRQCSQIWKTLPLPLDTCWPVLTEAAWLLRARPEAVERLLESTSTGLFRILSLTEEDGPGIARILKRYRTLKPQLADAAVVHLASREAIETIFTLDQRDFRVYRGTGNRTFTLLPG